MNIEEAIRTRRSVGRVKSDPVPRELIEKIIEAAVWAPNHHQTEPWRFIVMTGKGREVLGAAYAEIAKAALAGLSEQEQEERLAKERAKALRAPVVVTAVCSPGDGPKVDEAEELAAANAAVQNLLLAAHANGLGAIWRSGAPMYHPLMKSAFGLEERESIVGLVYVGYPELLPSPGVRTPGTEKTTWLE